MIRTIKAEKVGMTSVFDGAGTTMPVTLIRPFKAVVTQIKTPAKHGYSAIQLAYKETSEKHVNAPQRGILRAAGVKGSYRRFFEVRVPEEELGNYTVGQEINPSDFMLSWAEVLIQGRSKGKGFAGAVKRWGFRGQCRSHGDPHNRRPQSAGATDAARVFKGKRGPGHMGDRRVTLQNCSVFEYFRSLNVLVVTGSVPGPNGREVTVTVTREFTPEELAEHEASITLDEAKVAAEQKSSAPEAEPAPAEKPAEPTAEAPAPEDEEPEAEAAAAGASGDSPAAEEGAAAEARGEEAGE